MTIYCVLVASRFNDANGKAEDYEVGELLTTDLLYGTSLLESGFVRLWTDEDDRQEISEDVAPETLVATKTLPPRPSEEAAEWREALVVDESALDEVEAPPFDFSSIEVLDDEGFDIPEILAPAPVVEVLATAPAKKLARELGIQLADVDGSGPDGKITKADVYVLGNQDG